MRDIVHVRREPDGLLVIAPEGAPTVLDRAPALDVLVLEVVGGHLTWSLLDEQPLPAAVIDDVDSAQDWIWAVFGEQVAVTVDDLHLGGASEQTRTAVPGTPALTAAARRLSYAYWAARWWPASTLDGIAPLDERLLAEEIATLAEACELVVDGADPSIAPAESPSAPTDHADDYALAAGTTGPAPPGALMLARGSGGWDWRRCPSGLLDASERAVSWELLRHRGSTSIRVMAVVAPGLVGEVAPHLHPHALVRTADSTVDFELLPDGDVWTGTDEVPDGAETVVTVQIHVPGVGATDETDDPDLRRRIREVVATRLARAATSPDDGSDTPLLAEITAAATDSDF